MNANGGAQVGKWKTAVIAPGRRAATGPVWVSSQLATLEIAAPFVTFAMERAAVEQGKSTRPVLQGHSRRRRSREPPR